MQLIELHWKNEVIIIDENTGRKMTGRRYSEGLHEAVEAKEGLVIRNGVKLCSHILQTTEFIKNSLA